MIWPRVGVLHLLHMCWLIWWHHTKAAWREWNDYYDACRQAYG